MFNHIVLVGRIVKEPEIHVTKSGRNFSYITLAVNRPYKNSLTGLYDTDFIPCKLWGKIAINVVNHCYKGSLIGVRGRLETRPNDDPSLPSQSLEVVAERVSFINHPKHIRKDKIDGLKDDLETRDNHNHTDETNDDREDNTNEEDIM